MSPAATPLAGKTVCLDPGHPSENGVGARGKRISEVRAAWLVALQTRDLLVADGAAVVLTKKTERELVTNRRRARIANEARADLMVRLHCDAASASGTSTYYPDRAGRSGGVRGPSRAVIERSAVLARRFHAAMMDRLQGALADRGVLPDTRTYIGGRQGALTGSIFSRVPVLLVEMAVLTDPRDDAFLASPSGRRRMALALRDGVRAALLEAGGSV